VIVTITLSPGTKRLTRSPTARTTPEEPCPGMAGAAIGVVPSACVVVV
jgi:hypothetical protein